MNGLVRDAQRQQRSTKFNNLYDFQLFKFEEKQAGKIFQSLDIITGKQLSKLVLSEEMKAALRQVQDQLKEFSDLNELRLNDSILKELKELNRKLDNDKQTFLNGLHITFVSQPNFEKALNVNAAKTAVGFYQNEFIIIGQQTVNAAQLSKLKQTLTFIESTKFVHKFQIPSAFAQ